MHRTLAIAAGALLAAGALTSTAAALNSGDTSSRKIAVSHAAIAGFTGSQTVTATMRLSFPTSWKRVASPATRVSLRTGSLGCRYSIVARTAVSVGSPADTTAAAYALSLTPATGRLVLDEGVRGTSAWRVTRIRQASNLVILRAVGASPLNSMSKQLGLTGGRRAFQVTTVEARSGEGDECHSGTYRNVVGPSIGDALATARGRAYIDVVRNG
jgi:hypothetical protein